MPVLKHCSVMSDNPVTLVSTLASFRHVAVHAYWAVVQIRITRETWKLLIGAALATFGATHKSSILTDAGCRIV